MAILTTNPTYVAGTTIQLDEIFIICAQPQVLVVNPNLVKVTISYWVYESAAKWVENWQDNMLRIEGLVKRNFTAEYNRTVDGDIFDFIDVKTKEDLMKAFPTWEADLIIFIPEHVE